MEIPYTVEARPDTGLYNAKVGIWLFLASEVMLFGGFFSAYVLLRVGAEPGTWPHGWLNVTARHRQHRRPGAFGHHHADGLGRVQGRPFRQIQIFPRLHAAAGVDVSVHQGRTSITTI